MSTIRILSGSYRKQAVVNTEFTLVKGFQTGKKGSYVTVKNDGQFAINIPEVKVLVDNINEIYNSNYEFIITETGYGIRVNRENMLDNTVYSANGMIPPSIHDLYNGAFQSGVPYRVQGRFGWDQIPDNVELAAIELMKDFFSKDTMWKNKYVKKISTFDWDFEYTGNAYSGTGNAYADKLLADYVLDVKVDII
jgi:hypothetical protein